MGLLDPHGGCRSPHGPPDQLSTQVSIILPTPAKPGFFFARPIPTGYISGMTNTTSLWLAIFIAAAITVDLYFDLGGAIFLLRKLIDLIEWLSFWR